MPTSTTKIATALAKIRGKTIDRLFVADHGDRFRMFVVFTDGTNYEFYGKGGIEGARSIAKGDAEAVRKQLARVKEGEVVEIGNPHLPS